ncbi:cysteine-rich receptor-like protein kinase 8, partial [Tanacetum coccineum]
MTEPALFQNPLYLHPSDGPSSVTIQEKLVGAQNYRAWKRAIEIGVSTKRKLRFVKGTVVRSATDANLAELWDTYNNMVICWLMGSVSESIARSIMFIGTASEIGQQLEASSVGEYYTKMKCVWEELDNLNVLPVISRITHEITLFLTALNKQKEEQRLFQFLNGLEDHYSHQRSQILMNVPLPNVETACSLIQQEESQRLLFGSVLNVESIAFYPSWHPKHKGSQQSRQLRSGQVHGQERNQNGMNTFSAEEEIDHHQFVAGIDCLSSNYDLLEIIEGWIYDTGASDHMTPEEDSIFDPYHLLSVPKLTQDSQCVVSFYPTFCVVQDLTIRKVTGLGRLKEGLYHLINVSADKVDSVFSSLVKTSLQKFSLSVLSNKTVKDNYELWHHRIGHDPDVKLKQMHDLPVSLTKSCFDKCFSCPMEKFTKLPYSLSDSHSTSVFELIHIDIWGPYKVPTNGKFRYFLTIVDDCSRGTWTYLLEQKSDSFEALKSFIKFVATQFEKQVKIVKSDNALELVKGQCGSYLLSQGIVHQTSCVEPQQNRRGDCVTTATYLINRLHSSVVGNVTPYEILLKKKHVYDHLRVFGCLAMVSNPSRIADKFDPRGVPFQNQSSMPTRKSNRTKSVPTKLKDLVMIHTLRANQVSQTPIVSTFQEFVAALLVQKDPANFKEAVSDPGWCNAIDAELRALEENGTWELTSLHAGKKAIGSHWLFKTKFKADGSEERKKARLVVQAVKGWFTCQMDVSNTFLHGDLFEEVYMKPPLGYAGKGGTVSPDSTLGSNLADVGTPLQDPEIYRRLI